MTERAVRIGFLLPALLLVIVVLLIPNAMNVVFSLTDWNSFTSDLHFVGLDNLTTLIDDGRLVRTTGATLVYAAAVMVSQNILGLALALGLEKATRSNGVLRTVFFIPVLISALAAGFVFSGILDPKGPLNQILGGVFPAFKGFQWLADRQVTIFAVALIDSWKSVGITMLIYIAGLMLIPGELIDAAHVEGAGRWQLLRYVKLPLLAPAITVNVVLTLIGGLNTFDIIFATTQGGPGTATTVINLFIWKTYGQGFYGYALAMSMVLITLIAIIAIPLIVYLRRREVAM